MVSIVIPVYNEESILLRGSDYFKKLASSGELIFVDGGSSDQTVEVASKYSQVISDKKNRASQMNAGAKMASHHIILFLHADAQLSQEALSQMKAIMEQDGYVGGCFHQVYDAPGILFKWIALTGNMRAKLLNVFYGDQGIFVRKDIFAKLGGFPLVPIGEDVLLSNKLKHLGKTRVLPEYILCCARRWKKQGILKTFLFNMRITLGLLLRLNQDKIGGAYKDIR
ncbi:MAG: TIGR04283 family arsenosugar biosynthesis glycosyltransferase [Candidatus Zixiibacteriota bacterium]